MIVGAPTPAPHPFAIAQADVIFEYQFVLPERRPTFATTVAATAVWDLGTTATMTAIKLPCVMLVHTPGYPTESVKASPTAAFMASIAADFANTAEKSPRNVAVTRTSTSRDPPISVGRGEGAEVERFVACGCSVVREAVEGAAVENSATDG